MSLAIRLENLFWDVLAEIASREGKTTHQMIATLHEELTALREDNPQLHLVSARLLPALSFHAAAR